MKTVTERIVIDDSVIDKGNLYEIIDPVWWTGDIYNNEREYDQSLSAFSRKQRQLFAITWYITEVNNGGHHQFYWNSTGIVWQDAIEGFKAIGAAEIAEMIEKSTERLKDPPSKDRIARQIQLEQTDASFDDLDGDFYDIQSKINLDTLMLNFINEHREEFHFDGEVTRMLFP